MVGETLNGVKTGIEQVIQECEDKIQNADVHKQALDEKLVKSEELCKQKQVELENRRTSHAADDSALDEARSGLKVAKDAQKKGDAELNKTTKDKDIWEAVLREQYEPLKEMTLPPQKKGVQYPPQFKALKSHWQKNKLDNAVIEAATSTLSKSPSDRSEFENMVLKNIENTFAEKIQGFNQILAAGEPDQKARADAVASAQSALEAAQQKFDESRELVETAENEEVVLSSELADAQSAVENHIPEIERIKKEKEATQARLEEFVRITMGDFNTLRNGEPQPEEEPVQAVAQ